MNITFQINNYPNLVFDIIFKEVPVPDQDTCIRINERLHDYNWNLIGTFDVVYFEDIDFEIYHIDGNNVYMNAVSSEVHMYDQI